LLSLARKSAIPENGVMDIEKLAKDDWAYLLSLLPKGLDLDETARASGALVLPRVIRTAETLLRLILAYACCGLSLQQASFWAAARGLGELSKVAVMKRLRQSATWMSLLLSATLAERAGSLAQGGVRLRLVDATTVTIPGSQGTDWRLHVGFDLGSLSIDSVEVTGPEGGETYSRFKVREREVLIGDRGYAHRRGLWSVVQSGADFLLRLNWQNLPLQSLRGEAFDLFEALRQAGEDEAIEFSVQTAPTGEIPAMPARLVALRKSPEATEEARRKLLKEAKKKGRAVNPRTLEAAAYFFVLTSVSAQDLTAAQVLELYRFRWQIEMAFKRFKEILPLRQVPAKDPDLAKTYLLGNLLVALLTEDLARSFLAFSP
jgi:Transposase DDE domain